MGTFAARVAFVVLSVCLAFSAPAPAVAQNDRPIKVVVFGGHPDDPESGAGGLIATLTREGHEVLVAYGTSFRGDRRFFRRPEADVRQDEARAACVVLKATPKFFPYAHESLTADAETVKTVAAWLEDVKPDVVVTHWPLDTHPNHHAVSSVVWQCYKRSGGWNLYFFEVMTDQQTIAFRPELYLDIAPVRELKKRALDQHKSQGPESIWTSHERMHLRRGAECGAKFAEAYSLVEPKAGCPLLPVTFLARQGNERPVTISEPRRDEDGILTHTITSPYQAGTTEVRVLLPDPRAKETRYPVVYVLPVEAGNEHRYGDGLREAKGHDLANTLQAIFVAPTFAKLPWYADHPTDPLIRQEAYLLNVVVPLVDGRYPTRADPGGRLLLGFSKSGCGAWSLLMRHPDFFGKAAAWDAPLMMDKPGPYGSGPIFGTRENFAAHQITKLAECRASELRDRQRLILLGYGNFRDQHEMIHDVLVDLRIPHVYADGPQRKHVWGSGWLPEAASELVRRE